MLVLRFAQTAIVVPFLFIRERRYGNLQL